MYWCLSYLVAEACNIFYGWMCIVRKYLLITPFFFGHPNFELYGKARSKGVQKYLLLLKRVYLFI